MEQTISGTTRVCDFCDAKGCYYKCDGCGKDVCSECKKKIGMEYPHSLYFDGSWDGFFCSACIASPGKKKTLLRAYQNMAAMRAESKAFYENLDKRGKDLEETIKAERTKAGLKP